MSQTWFGDSVPYWFGDSLVTVYLSTTICGPKLVTTGDVAFSFSVTATPMCMELEQEQAPAPGLAFFPPARWEGNS